MKVGVCPAAIVGASLQGLKRRYRIAYGPDGSVRIQCVVDDSSPMVADLIGQPVARQSISYEIP